MKSLKRSVGQATGSGPDAFRSARWKLTVVYCAIIAAIVAVLSASLYEFHSHDVDRLTHAGPRRGFIALSPPDAGDRLERPDVAEYFERLGKNILFADLITLLVGGALSALLAGRTLRPIRRAVEAEKQFFANAAHDLRTPLAVMKSEAEVALRAGDLGGQEARRLLRSSLEEIDHMSLMVEQMLDLARGSGGAPGTAAPELHPMDLAALARGIVDRTQPRARQKGVRLAYDAAAPASIRGNEHALQRAVGNLLENALAYTPPGGSIEVVVRREHGHVLLRVDDTGIGIPEDDLPHVAEPFFRGDRARGVHPGGAGLGLTIVKGTVEAYGGTMRALRRAESGTSITLRFPSA
ncbi:MAG: sensor histidine kinase [Spirochaetia bacterium]